MSQWFEKQSQRVLFAFQFRGINDGIFRDLFCAKKVPKNFLIFP